MNYGNSLPHLMPIGATFFVTFRLADALPISVITALKQAYSVELKYIRKNFPAETHRQNFTSARKKYFGEYEHQLDYQPHGACLLRHENVAEIVSAKLKMYDQKWYDLIAYCIMPNHVHILIDFSIQLNQDDLETKLDMINRFKDDDDPEKTSYVQLDRVMMHIKGGSSYKINRLLGRSGKLWQKESFDHYIRNEAEWNNVVNYILQNPVKAGLVSSWETWKFNYYKYAPNVPTALAVK